MNNINNVHPPILAAYTFHALTVISAIGLIVSAFLPLCHSVPAAGYGSLIPGFFVLAIISRVLTLYALHKSINFRKNAGLPDYTQFGITYYNLRDFIEGKSRLAAFFNRENEDEPKIVPASQPTVEDVIALPVLQAVEEVAYASVTVAEKEADPLPKPTPEPKTQENPPVEVPVQIAVPLEPPTVPQLAAPPEGARADFIRGNFYKVTYADSSVKYLQEHEIPHDRSGILYIAQEWKKILFTHHSYQSAQKLPPGWKLECLCAQTHNYALIFPSNYPNTLKALKALRKLLGKSIQELEKEVECQIFYKITEVIKDHVPAKSAKWAKVTSQLMTILDKSKHSLPRDKDWIRYCFSSSEKAVGQLPKEWIFQEIQGRYELIVPDVENHVIKAITFLEEIKASGIQRELYQPKDLDFDQEIQPRSLLSRLVK